MASSSSLSLSFPASSLSRNWIHDVFPSFHGADVRTKILSHLLEKFRSKAIKVFIDNEIKRGESIRPELEQAIRGSKIAIVLLSENYASSSWCLDELVEIMKCRERLCQTVITIFYEVDPSDIKKQTGNFGKAFKETRQGKTDEKIETWIKALEDLATIADYHLINWDNEAVMIEKITTDILNILNHLTPSCDFERYIGMGTHIEKMKGLLRMDSDEGNYETGCSKSKVIDHFVGMEFDEEKVIKAIDEHAGEENMEEIAMTCLPSNLNMKFLVELNMKRSKLEKLWDGIKRLPNLKWVDLSYSKNLKELPDFSTATSLQKLNLRGCSSLMKLHSSIGNAINLKYLYLSHCSSLLRLPSSIGNAINLKSLFLGGCSSLSQIPSSIGNAINLEHLKLHGCSSLVELPTSIGNAINLEYLDFSGCSSLVELPASIGNLHKLKYLKMKGCSKLKVLPVNVNLKSLDELDLSDCSSLTCFPEISTNIRYLNLRRTAIEEVPSSIRSWSRLKKFDMYKCKKLKEFPHALDSKELLSLPQLPESLSELDCSKLDNLHLFGCSSLNRFPEISTNIRELNLSKTAIEEVPSAIWSWSRLETLDVSYCKKLKKFAHVLDRITERDVKKFPPLGRLILSGCKNILSLPQLPHSLNQLDAINCESLERLDCSLRHSYEDIHFNFPNCFKLNKEARDLIIQKSAREVSVLPGKEIPTYFTYRANGGSLIVKLKEMTFPSYLTFKACILLVGKNAIEGVDQTMYVDCEIIDKQNSLHVRYSGGKGVLHRPLTEHLYIFEVAALVASNELFFKFSLGNRNLSRKISDEWVIKECGVHGNCEGEEEENEGYSSDEEEEKENGPSGGRCIGDY